MTRKLNVDLLIDPNEKEGEVKFALSEGMSVTRYKSGNPPITVLEALRRITKAEEMIRNTQRGIDGMWAMIDAVHDNQEKQQGE